MNKKRKTMDKKETHVTLDTKRTTDDGWIGGSFCIESNGTLTYGNENDWDFCKIEENHAKAIIKIMEEIIKGE